LDTPDPIGPAKSLFQTKFYLNCQKILAPGGIIIRQTGSSILQPEEMPSNFRQMEELFPDVKVILTAITTYIGGYFTFVIASNKKGALRSALPKIAGRFKKMKLETEWYTPEIHKASMILPRELESSLKKTDYGVELVIDLYECDYTIMNSNEKLHEFVKELLKVIDMKAFGEPWIPDFGYSLSKTAGPSLVQLIESSSITAHYSPHWRMICMNVFTCKSFDPEKTLKFVKEFFRAGRARAFLLKRGPRIFRKDLDMISVHNPYEES
jgi:S-adenosylmethionine/arginine decarboxylase-like enzyme